MKHKFFILSSFLLIFLIELTIQQQNNGEIELNLSISPNSSAPTQLEFGHSTILECQVKNFNLSSGRSEIYFYGKIGNSTYWKNLGYYSIYPYNDNISINIYSTQYDTNIRVLLKKDYVAFNNETSSLLLKARILPRTLEAVGEYSCNLTNNYNNERKNSNVLNLTINENLPIFIQPSDIEISSNTSKITTKTFEIECEIIDWNWEPVDYFYITFLFSPYSLAGEPKYNQISKYTVNYDGTIYADSNNNFYSRFIVIVNSQTLISQNLRKFRAQIQPKSTEAAGTFGCYFNYQNQEPLNSSSIQLKGAFPEIKSVKLISNLAENGLNGEEFDLICNINADLLSVSHKVMFYFNQKLLGEYSGSSFTSSASWKSGELIEGINIIDDSLVRKYPRFATIILPQKIENAIGIYQCAFWIQAASGPFQFWSNKLFLDTNGRMKEEF